MLQATKAGHGGPGTRLITSTVVLPSLECHSIVLHYIAQNLKTKEIFTFRGHTNFVYFVIFRQYSSLPQLLRIGFDEETSQLDTKNLLQQIINIRHPSHITRGLKQTTPLTSPDVSLSLQYVGREPPLLKNKNKNDPRHRGELMCWSVYSCFA